MPEDARQQAMQGLQEELEQARAEASAADVNAIKWQDRNEEMWKRALKAEERADRLQAEVDELKKYHYVEVCRWMESENAEVKRLKARLSEEIELHSKRVQAYYSQRTALQGLAEALRESLRLGDYALKEELTSSSHNHGPLAAARYGEKRFALEQKIRAALAAAAPFLEDK